MHAVRGELTRGHVVARLALRHRLGDQAVKHREELSTGTVDLAAVSHNGGQLGVMALPLDGPVRLEHRPPPLQRLPVMIGDLAELLHMSVDEP